MKPRSYAGGCHCGAIRVVFRTALPPARWALRSCTCDFCSRHASRAATDPAGLLRVALRRPARLSRLDWKQGKGGRLVCAHCGVYVALALRFGKGWLATLNVNALDNGPAGKGFPVDYSGETAAAKRKRREARWTPTEILPI